MSAHCYAERIQQRFGQNKSFLPGEAIIRCHPERLGQPLKWRKPSRIFVNSMSDLFHEDVPDEFVAKVLEVIIDCPQHTFQVLTKRPARMLEYMTAWQSIDTAPDMPPNLHLGVSVENQYWADRRIPLLAQTPAAVRFVSLEPLLKPVYLRLVEGAADLDWLIIGGESGPGARPFDTDWARTIIDQARIAGKAVFVKQLGSVWAKQHVGSDSKGGNMECWPEDLRVREFPKCQLEAV